MSRDSRYANSGAYRVVEKLPNGDVYRVWGPYATKGAAKGRRTSLSNQHSYYPSGHSFQLEVIVGPWKELNE